MSAPARRCSSIQQRRSSLPGAVRRNSKNITQSALNDISIHLGRVVPHETPTNRKERLERRSNRKEDFARIHATRSDRMESVKEKWTNHRKSFVCEENEIERIVKENQRWNCCGLNLCCTW